MLVFVELVDMVLASARVNGPISLRDRFGNSITSAVFWVSKPSRVAAARIVDNLVIALRFTFAEVHSVLVMTRRSRVVVTMSIRTRARRGTQYRFRALL